MKLKSYLSLLTFFMLLLALPAVFAAGFSAGISPPKFELKAKPGKVIRDTITILNASDKTGNYSFRTADWTINAQQGVDFMEEGLADNSCRPWVRLERRDLKIRSGGQKKYRFEVHVPENATPGLCKFAILIEPGDKTIASATGQQQLKFPVVGRYAVIVYLAIGDARADITYLGLGKQQTKGTTLPTLKFRNSGNNYDRAFGNITATGKDGKRHELLVSTFPVLPGHTEEISLSPDTSDSPDKKVKLVYPLTLKGKIEIGGKTFSINERLE